MVIEYKCNNKIQKLGWGGGNKSRIFYWRLNVLIRPCLTGIFESRGKMRTIIGRKKTRINEGGKKTKGKLIEVCKQGKLGIKENYFN